MNKPELRRHMRQQRRQLSPAQRQQAARQLRRQLHRTTSFLNAKRVAVYLANDGEIDPQYVIKSLWQRGKDVYLPVLNPLRHGHLQFVRYQKNSRMRRNRYGINEPDPRYNSLLNTRFLSVICLPLVAFDEQGNRLGMGGGYYDRSLAFCRKNGQKPRLIGCAYEFQCLPQLPTEPWDIPLQAIASDRYLRLF
ncbi:MAG: 5-formyltetrahydrofolate cyclo-ligase [Bacterioplanes sp.]|nr:5-formyltetrahydrofolate cyclo-ligase [Bacterioplanes sp.]